MAGAVPKYARPERERRFVLDAVPPGATAGRRIVDRYVRGTRLRLREVGEGDDADLKLGHKVRPDEADPRLVLHTTIYLTRPEFDLLTALPADTLVKQRAWVPAHGGGRIAVDTFEGARAGLILAEIELAEIDGPFEPPTWALAEVSTDERFTGGRLATMTRGELHRALADVVGTALRSAFSGADAAAEPDGAKTPPASDASRRNNSRRRSVRAPRSSRGGGRCAPRGRAAAAPRQSRHAIAGASEDTPRVVCVSTE